MNEAYYVMNDGAKEGPLDLVTIMRRVRAGKIKPDTDIYINDSEFPKRADSVDNITPFFQRLLEGPANARALPDKTSLGDALKAGWSFTQEHNIMTVYAGGMLLLVLFLTLIAVSQLGLMTGLLTSWCVFMIFHNMYFVFAARFFRGQTFGDDFINMQLAPVLLPLVISSLLFAIAVALGLALLIIPGILAAAFLIFTPLILLDRQCSIPEALKTSCTMVRKAGSKHLVMLSTLLGLHLLCFVLIMPVPLTLPIFIAALCEMYEKLST